MTIVLNQFPCSYSSKIIWLKLSSSNHNPKIIARYYLESVENAGGKVFIIITFYYSKNSSTVS